MKHKNRFSLLGIGLMALCLMFGTGPAVAGVVDDGAGNVTVRGDNTDPLTYVDDTTVNVRPDATLTVTGGGDDDDDAITFTGDNNAVINNGAITATDGSAITVTYDNDAETTQSHTVTNNGAITGVSGISFCTDPDLYPNEEGVANNDVVNNYGTIEATGAYLSGGIESDEEPAAVAMGEGADLLNNYEGAAITGSVLMGPGNDQIFNWGSMTSTYGAAVKMGDGSDTLENAGTITAEDSDCAGVSMGDGDDTFTNTGTIDIGTTSGAGVSMADGDDTFTNTGTIDIDTTSNAGISMADGDDTVTNTGTITMTDIGSNGITMADGKDVLTNSGRIEIEYASTGAVTMGDGDDTLTNSGTITLDESGGHGIAMGDENDTLTNSGTITLGDISSGGISLANGNDVFTNSGTVTIESAGNGGISTANGNDVFTNSGTVTMGDIGTTGVTMADGDDVFTNSGTLTIGEAGDGGIIMAEGNDTFTNSGKIRIGSAGTAGINLGEGNDTFDNTGWIRINDAGSPGISLGAGHDVFTNSGTVIIGEAGSPGINLGDSSAGEDEDDDVFTNTGTISIEDAGTVGINMGNYGDDTFTNSGTITIGYAENNGINMGEYGSDTFTNSGAITISEAGYNGIHFGDEVSVNTFENSGTITIGTVGNNAIHFASAGFDTFTNSGTIRIAGVAGEYAGEGCIAMGSDNDVLTNSGTIELGYLGGSAADYAAPAPLEEDDVIETTYIAQAYKGIALGPDNDKLVNTGIIRIGYMGSSVSATSKDLPESSGGDYSGIIGGSGNDTLDNSGTIEIVKTDQHGIIMSDGWDTITNTGTITIGDTGYGAIAMSDGEDTFDNAGTVTIGTSGYAGISMADGRDTFTNSGTIEIGETGLEESGGSGISMGGENDAFTNTGIIRIGTSYSTGITMGCGNDTFDNSGNIRIRQTLTDPGLTLGDGDDVFTNTGTIRIGTAQADVEEGDYGAAIAMGGGDDTFTNAGELYLGDGFYNIIKGGCDDDMLINEGYIEGGIVMSDGDDTVILRSGTTVTGAINGQCTDPGDAEGTIDGDLIVLEGQGLHNNDILNFDVLEKTGDGRWRINGLVTVDDLVDVQAGTLFLNDDISGYDGTPDIEIASGATLTANGINMDGDVENSGTFSLGGNIQSTMVTGDFTNAAGATLALGLSDTGECDNLTVGGTAGIEGGTILVTPVGVLQDGSTYTVLTAGTLDGAFDQATANSMVLSFEMDDETEPNSIILETDRQSYAAALAGAGLTGNQAAISHGLMQLINDAPDGDLADVINALDRQPDAASLANALGQLSPELYTLGTALTGVNTGGFTSGMTGRLSGLRVAATNRATDAGPVLAAAPTADRQAGQGWSPWAKAFYTTAEQDTSTGFMGYDYDAMGLSLGIDKGVADNMVVGVTLGIAKAEADVDANMGEQDVDTFSVGAYGSWTGDKVYVDGALLFGFNSYDSLRHIPLMGVTAVGDHEGIDYSAYIGGGYMAAMGDWNLIPTASLQYTLHEEKGFIETGAGAANLAVDKTDTDSLMGKLGVRVNRLFQMNDGMGLKPEVSLQWGHEFADRDQQAVSWFAGTSTGTFAINGLEANRDSGILGLSLTAFMGDSLSLSAGYEATMKEEFEAHTFTAGLRYMF